MSFTYLCLSKVVPNKGFLSIGTTCGFLSIHQADGSMLVLLKQFDATGSMFEYSSGFLWPLRSHPQSQIPQRKRLALHTKDHAHRHAGDLEFVQSSM